MMNPVLRLPMNQKGRDIVVADPHGQFSLLKKALVAIEFNTETDRLIIAGDLVDRGENSIVSAQWIAQPYCYSVVGNHDAQFLFSKSQELFRQSLVCMPLDPWFCSLSDTQLEHFENELRKHLYPAIEIETANGLVGIVHAEVPSGLSWTEMTSRLNQSDYELLYSCIWNREIAKECIRGIPSEEQEVYRINDIAYVFHGHTNAKKLNYYPYRVANRLYIDTAAYKAGKDKYPTAGITLFDASIPDKPLYTTGTRALIYADQL